MFWDTWKKQALDAGVSPHLAELLCGLMRDHFEQYRDYPECEPPGGYDPNKPPVEGARMIQQCLRAPLHAELRYLGDRIWMDTGKLGDEDALAILTKRLGSAEVLQERLAAERVEWETLK